MLTSTVVLAAAVAAFIVMGGAYWLSLVLKDASVADIAWGLCFVAIAWSSLDAGLAAGDRGLIVCLLVSAWGLRLAAYISWRHDGEDRRYRAMREKHGGGFGMRSAWSVFGLQAAIAFVVSLPIQVTMVDGEPLEIGTLGYIGIAVCVISVLIESIADLQLARFLKRPDSADRVMDEGIWRYSRHPNYFGDALFWWGIWLIALETGSTAIWTVVSPILMTLLLLRVSGVTLTEKTITTRRPGYAEYVERTSAFVPLPPKRSSTIR